MDGESSNMADMLGIMMQMFGGADEAQAVEQAAKMRQAMEMAKMFQMLNAMSQAQGIGENEDGDNADSEDVNIADESATSEDTADTTSETH
ncbi:MAG: hypothetical protein FWD96_04895, partial [Defluviitaleaceae bacterium]|nr:hypothetical protein [Defluviitaleaceae bacterium]